MLLGQSSLDIYEKLYGESDSKVAEQLISVARFCQKQGNYFKAEQHLNRAIDLFVKAADQPNVAKTRDLLAAANLEQALQALSKSEKKFGKRHIAVAASLSSLVVLLAKRNMFKEAEPYCRRAIKIRKEHLGDSKHPVLARQLRTLALLCYNQGKYAEAEKCLRYICGEAGRRPSRCGQYQR